MAMEDVANTLGDEMMEDCPWTLWAQLQRPTNPPIKGHMATQIEQQSGHFVVAFFISGAINIELGKGHSGISAERLITILFLLWTRLWGLLSVV